ncbi:hypothetical protein PZ61_0235705 [Streptomyces sp. MNU77]|nr:hypothetical protein PZ61_0235705 [Streptomyces sp. MNU77]
MPAGLPLSTADVRFHGPYGLIDAYLARPPGGSRGGVLVVHEAFGPVEHVRDVARRFAAIGYDALAPDLYSGRGTPDPADVTAVMAAMFSLPDAEAVGSLTACARYLRDLDGATGRTACVGFCSGGRQSLLLACAGPVVDVAVDCWGGFVDRASPAERTTAARPVPPLDRADRLVTPLLVIGGAEDTEPAPELLERLALRLKDAPAPHRLSLYEDAGHAFFADYRPTYRPEPAARLWAEIQEFLERHLG